MNLPSSPPDRPVALPPRLERLLSHGPENAYRDSSTRTPAGARAAMAVIAGACRRGWPCDAICDRILSSTLGDMLRGEWGEQVERKLRRKYQLAKRRAEETQPQVVRRLAAIEEILPRGRRGATCRQVYAALVEIELSSGKAVFAASVRELSEVTRVASHQAICRAMKKLEELGVLRHAVLNARTGERGWALTHRPSEQLATQSPREAPCVGREYGQRPAHSQGSSPRPAIPVLHDLWSWRGLGPNAQRVYARLREAPARVSNLHAELGISRSGLSKNAGDLGILQRLAGHGMAERRDDGTWVAISRDLDDVAEELGVLGRRARLAAQHDIEREQFERLQAAIRGQKLRAKREAQTVDRSTGEIVTSASVARSEHLASATCPGMHDPRKVADKVRVSGLEARREGAA